MVSDSSTSVVVPAFNAACYLGEAIESCLGQTVPPSEVLVIDDGSDDDSVKIAAAFGDRVKVVSQQNGGEANARNRGLREAVGDWIAFLDADDKWHPRKLEMQLAAIDEAPNEFIACHTNYQNFGAHDEVHDVSGVPEAIRYSLAHIAVHVPILPSSLMVKAGLPIRFPEWARGSVDVIYCLELSRLGRIAFVAEPLMFYRRHQESMSAGAGFLFRAHEAVFRWLAENQGTIAPEVDRDIREGHFERLFALSRKAIWRRDWRQVDEIAEFLQAYGEDPVVRSFLDRRRLPRWAYGLKDRLSGRFA